MADAGAVVDAIVATLDEVRSDGPISRKGEPEWSGFDWKERCHIETVAVYATAGMRLAQQQNAGASAVLWEMLNDRLSSALGMEVTARTLTGYEEAVFAWLAVREGLDEGDFGVAEMGGASVQIAFPCAECETARQVRVKGHIVPLYADSFLGWGQDEAWEKLGPLPACERGVGLQNPNWQIADCATGTGMVLADAIEFRRYVDNAQDLRWYLSGAFRYMRDTDIDHFCRKGLDSGFQPDTSCFRAIYLQNVLNALRVPMKSAHSTADWPLGAVICTATQCL